MSVLEVHQFECLSDNYGFLVHDPDSGSTACVDTPDAQPTLSALEEKGWSLTQIWNTHWHPDHTGGNLELQKKTGCEILGPRNESERVPGIEMELGEGSTFDFGAHPVRVFDVPGHTAGHIAYWLPDDSIAFVGDTLFALGCGRLFEGTAEQMWNSLGKLAALPPETVVYCAHEYTQANAQLALSVDPGNGDLVARARKIDEMRAQGIATVPTTVEVELATNPFLRADVPAFQRAIGMEGADPVEVFAETRKRKDSF